jgi:hypothetical protein
MELFRDRQRGGANKRGEWVKIAYTILNPYGFRSVLDMQLGQVTDNKLVVIVDELKHFIQLPKTHKEYLNADKNNVFVKGTCLLPKLKYRIGFYEEFEKIDPADTAHTTSGVVRSWCTGEYSIVKHFGSFVDSVQRKKWLFLPSTLYCS